jgi:O-methyltransferase
MTAVRSSALTARYLALLKRSLLNELYLENEARLVQVLSYILNNGGRVAYENAAAIDPDLLATLRRARETGESLMLQRNNPDGTSTPMPSLRNYTELAHTMIGRRRLDHLQECIETVLRDEVPGDLIETGIWRGGATILMRGVLAAYEVSDRIVWAADSFQGVPAPTRPEDAGFDISAARFPVLAVSRAEVTELFARYGLLDEQVRFLEGWFRDTLAAAPIERLAVLRLDGDLYESTMDALVPLYPKVAPGGFIIIDDYASCPPCGRAVNEFRTAQGIREPLIEIDAQSVYWRKT